MLLEERDRFPIRKITFYDTMQNVRKTIAKRPAKFICVKTPPDIGIWYTTDPETGFSPILILCFAHSRVGQNIAMRETKMKKSR